MGRKYAEYTKAHYSVETSVHKFVDMERKAMGNRSLLVCGEVFPSVRLRWPAPSSEGSTKNLPLMGEGGILKR